MGEGKGVDLPAREPVSLGKSCSFCIAFLSNCTFSWRPSEQNLNGFRKRGYCDKGVFFLQFRLLMLSSGLCSWAGEMIVGGAGGIVILAS